MAGTIISLFSGTMGMDLGFEAEGFDIRVAVEKRPEVVATINKNRPNIPVIAGDIFKTQTSEILKEAHLHVGEATVLTGAPPCQSFSTNGKRHSFREERGKLVFEFLRVLEEARPRFFVFENVVGFLSASLQHMSFYKRMKMDPEEVPWRTRPASAFKFIFKKFEETGYKICGPTILNAADYGTPQNRRRVFIFGSRNSEAIPFPVQTNFKRNSGEDNVRAAGPYWITLGEAIKGIDGEHHFAKMRDWGKLILHVPPGGNWRDLPPNLKRKALGGALGLKENRSLMGGRTGFCRRLGWDQTCPTLVTSPLFKSSSLIHPSGLRPLSVEEYAKIQGFPKDWEFEGSLMQNYRMIGEATPVPLARAVAKVFRELC